MQASRPKSISVKKSLIYQQKIYRFIANKGITSATGMAPSVNSSSSSFSIAAAPTPASPSGDAAPNTHDSMKGKTYGDYLFEEDIGHGTFST
jgi:hypothetical protein